MTPMQTIIPSSSTPPHAACVCARLVEMGNYQRSCQDHYTTKILQAVLEDRNKN